MEVEGDESINLPPNLVEDSIEAVDTAVKRYILKTFSATKLSLPGTDKVRSSTG